MKGAAALPLAAILADPVLAAAAAAGAEDVTLKLDNGKMVTASVVMPDVTPAPAVILVHEWWGLNDQIKAVGAELAKLGYVAVSVDLYDGQVGTTPDEAKKYMSSVDPVVATETLEKWVGWAREHDQTTEKVGTIGWCFGGGWSLNASIAAPVDATIVYYGNVAKNAEQLKSLKGPVMGHFATKDQWINKEMVDGFVEQMKLAGEPAPKVFWYEADHAFANPSGGRYDEADAQLAWRRSTEFFTANLQG
jgi:carboxymethylenebutenolidase